MIPVNYSPFTKWTKTPRRAMPLGELAVLRNCVIENGNVSMYHGWKRASSNPISSLSTWNDVTTGWNATTGDWHTQTQSTNVGTIRHIQWHIEPDGVRWLCIHTDTGFVVYDPLTDTFTDYTPVSPYTSCKTWSSCSYGSLYVFTNGVDSVQKWNAAGTSAAADLGGSPDKCIIVRTIGSYLMLIGLTSDYRAVKWSRSTDCELFTGGDSGSLTVYDGIGIIVGAEVLGYDSLIIYKGTSIHHYVMSGYPYYFVQQTRILGYGAGGPKCIANAGGIHVVLSKGGLFKYDGVQAALFDKESADMLSGIASGETIEYAIVLYDYAKLRILVFTPDQDDDGVLNNLFMYLIKDGTWSQQEVNITTACIGTMPKQVDTWDTSTASWDSLKEEWDSTVSVGTDRLVLGDLEGYIQVEDIGVYTRVGVEYTGVMETGFIQPGFVLFQKPNTNCELVQIDLGLLTGNPTVQVGVSDKADEDITWSAPWIVVDGIAYGQVYGRYFTVRLSSNLPFSVNGLTIYFVPRGVV